MKGAQRRQSTGGRSTVGGRFWKLFAPPAFLCLPLTTHHHHNYHHHHHPVGPPSTTSSSSSSHFRLVGGAATVLHYSSSSPSSSSSSSISSPDASTETPPVKLPRSVSPSSLGDFKQCPRLYRFRHIERIPEPPSGAMVRGIMVHDALEKVCIKVGHS